MSTICDVAPVARTRDAQLPHNRSASITWAASKQTYYTIRLLVDRDRVQDAYRAYAYFRWVDDRLDEGGLDLPACMAFVERQQMLINRCYQGAWPEPLADEEQLLIDLIRGDTEPNSGLQAYIRNLMAVMEFDARRRGRLVSAVELSRYTHWLAVAVTEGMLHFIGHGARAPQGEARYLAVTAAHIAHMLRDALEDAEAGYVNIPHETLESHGIDPRDVRSAPYRAWVQSRVCLARSLFADASGCVSNVGSLRYRLAVYAYTARFQYVLDAIERDGFELRAAYPGRKSLAAAVRMGCSVLAQAAGRPRPRRMPRVVPAR